MKQLALDILQPPVPTLENFVVGRNAEALTHVRAALAGTGERFVYLWGEAGCGRTHLLKAASSQGSYTNCSPDSTFADDAQVHAVDNVERLNAGGQEALFHRYNRLREAGGVLLASGPLPPVQLKLRADLLTRLAWGLVIELHALTDAEKSHTLTQHARDRGLNVPGEVIRYLLTHTPRGMGELYVMLDTLDRLSLETKRAITVPLAKRVIREKPNKNS
jgi:DnaA family protein